MVLILGGRVLVVAGKLLVSGRVFEVDDCARPIAVVLRLLGRKPGQPLGVVRPAIFDLLELGQVHEPFEIEDHARQVECRLVARIEVLVRSAIRDLDRAALVPVETLAVDDAEPLAIEDVHRLFAMAVFTRVPAGGDLGFQHVAAHGREAEIVRDHQLDSGVLAGAHPWNFAVARDVLASLKALLDLVVGRQPIVVKRAHSVPPTALPI